MWYELLNIAQTICLSTEDDAMIWKYEAKGVYSVNSLYAVVNFRGVVPVYSPAVWKVTVPPKIQFLWLIAHNKIATIDNLVKRQSVDGLTYALCSEPETCKHLFFECVVAKVVWGSLYQHFFSRIHWWHVAM
jgi:hypothetical protein